jgi:hypothetical protein
MSFLSNSQIGFQFSNLCPISNSQISVQFSNLWSFLTFSNRCPVTSLTQMDVRSSNRHPLIRHYLKSRSNLRVFSNWCPIQIPRSTADLLVRDRAYVNCQQSKSALSIFMEYLSGVSVDHYELYCA